ncbi:MAG: D-aminoacylase [Clostridiaceae bacterium]
MKTLLKNAWIVDGTGSKGFGGDLLLENDRIAAVEPAGVLRGEFDQTIDAAALTAAPGFIDTHSHSDLEALLKPAILPKLHQGITTEVLGQDGISMAPLKKEYVAAWRQNIGGLEGDSDLVRWDELETVGGYLHALKSASPLANYAYLAPHGNLRLSAMGMCADKADGAQLKRMEQELRCALEAGAAGLSTGLVYTPCVYAASEELTRLCHVLHEYDRPFVVHQRYESDRIAESMEELLEIALHTGAHLHISHFKITGARNAHKRFEVFALIERYRERGVRFTADQYPYIAGSTMLGRIIPPWAHAGGTDELLSRLTDHTQRERIKSDIRHTETVWDNMVSVCSEAGIVVTSVTKPQNERFVGHNIVEIGGMTGSDPLDAAMDLLVDERNKVGMICKNGVEEVMRDILVRKDVNVCTDGLLGGTPHPRVYGAFPKVIASYVRAEKLLSLEEAIRKMTSQAASAMGLKERGALKPGYFADIVLFDAEEITDVGDYRNPRRYARGVRYVFVNGKKALDSSGVREGAASGKVLRAT